MPPYDPSSNSNNQPSPFGPGAQAGQGYPPQPGSQGSGVPGVFPAQPVPYGANPGAAPNPYGSAGIYPNSNSPYQAGANPFGAAPPQAAPVSQAPFGPPTTPPTPGFGQGPYAQRASTNPYSQGGQPVPQGPQPARPAVPFFLDPNGPYAHIGAQPHRKRKNKKLRLVILLVGLAVVVGGFFVALQGSGNDPDAVFQTAIQNSLATHSYSYRVDAGKDNIQLKQDVNSVKTPRQSGTADLPSLGEKVEGYSSIKNSYIRYTQLSADASATAATALNKWEQIRKDGVLPASYTQEANLGNLFEARTSIMGNYIIGNFSVTDQQDIFNLIQTKGVYSYDAGTVSEEQVDHQPVMRFDVKINADGLTALNQKVGALMGLSQADVDATIKHIDPGTIAKETIKMYVSTDTQRLVKVAVTQGSDTSTTLYSAFDSSVVANEPTPDYQYDEFQALLTGKASTSLTGKAQDTERKADINAIAAAIEAFNKVSHFYPTFDDMNSADWLSANLPNLKDTSLIDPSGTSKQFADAPKANQYSFQAYKDNSLASCKNSACNYYKVSATLSDGSVYSKSP